jgi:hypothetical protein
MDTEIDIGRQVEKGMKLKDQSCGQCRYWKLSPNELGACHAPIPVSLSGWFVKTTVMYSTDGYSCPAYRKRINRRKSNVTPITQKVQP